MHRRHEIIDARKYIRLYSVLGRLHAVLYPQLLSAAGRIARLNTANDDTDTSHQPQEVRNNDNSLESPTASLLPITINDTSGNYVVGMSLSSRFLPLPYRPSCERLIIRARPVMNDKLAFHILIR